MPKTGYNFVNRLMKEGFYVNLGIFPAVPVKNTGVRITISRHNQKEEIKGLVEAMEYHFPKALEDTHTNPSRVFQAFKLDSKLTTRPLKKEIVNSDLIIRTEDSILNIEKGLWNGLLGRNGVFDWDGLKFLEQTFSDNPLKEHNWKFKYLIIFDKQKTPILATFLTNSLWKDDMLANVGASQTIEADRQSDPYYLTSKVLSIGSLFTEGDHLYLDIEHPSKKEALGTMLQTLENWEQTLKAKMIVLRDFSEEIDLHSYFQGQGFVRIKMPESCGIDLKETGDIEAYISQLSSRNRRHLRKEILETEPLLKIAILNSCSKDQLIQIHELYSNVHQNNLGLNTFSFPVKLFENMSLHPNWEFITIYPHTDPDKMIGVMLCFKNIHRTYVPAYVGIDYSYLNEFHIYRQLLYQTIKRAIEINSLHIAMGLTAAFEKRKLGASVQEKYAYIQTADNYTLELMGVMESS